MSKSLAETTSIQELAQKILDVAKNMREFSYDTDLIDVALNVITQLCTEQLVCPRKREDKHDGDLGHNASVCLEDEQYICDDGDSFYAKEVQISDKMRHVVLIPREALSLLDWLKQEEAELRRLAKEQAE